MKQKKSIKKYGIDSAFTDTLSNQMHLTDIREQLRHTIEQLQQYKLSSQLENQKRVIAQQQYHMLKQQNSQLRNQLDNVRKQLSKFLKKYSKVKQQKNCERCKAEQQLRQKAERQRQIFIKQRNVLKNQINELKGLLQVAPINEQSRISGNIDQLRKQVDYKTRTIEDQRKIIKYLDEKLSNFQIEKLQTLNYVEQVDQKLQQLQMQNLILRGVGNRDHGSPVRKNGSIKNLQKSRSRISKMSPTRY